MDAKWIVGLITAIILALGALFGEAVSGGLPIF